MINPKKIVTIKTNSRQLSSWKERVEKFPLSALNLRARFVVVVVVVVGDIDHATE